MSTIPDSKTFTPGQILTIIAIGVLVQIQTLLGSRLVEAADAKVHFRWVEQFARALEEGVIYPRWAALSYEGLGDPSFLYIHPLFYYASAALRTLTGDTVSAMLWACTLAGIAGAFATVRLLSGHLRPPDRLPAVICALLLLSPYGFHLASYQQFLPMQFAMAFMAVYLAALTLPFGRHRRVTLALTVGLTTASHILMAFMMLLCSLPALIRIALREPPGQHLRALLSDGISIGVGLSLAGIYLVPALGLQSLITPSGWYVEKYLDWHNSFLFQTSLTMPPYGFRWFHLQWTVPLATLGLYGFLIWGLWRIRRNGHSSHRTQAAADFALIAGLALLLGAEPAYPLWATSTTLQRLQFPVRFLSVASVATVLAFGLVISELHAIARRHLAPAAIVLALAGTLAMLLALEWQFFREARPAAELMRPAERYPGQTEMRPAGAGPGWRDWLRNGGFEAECRRHGAICTTVVARTHEHHWNIVLPGPATLRLPLFAFPGWQIDGGASRVVAADPDNGLFTVTLPAGDHHVEAHWHTLTHEWIGLGVSSVALLAVALLALPLHRQREQPET